MRFSVASSPSRKYIAIIKIAPKIRRPTNIFKKARAKEIKTIMATIVPKTVNTVESLSDKVYQSIMESIMGKLMQTNATRARELKD
jgi:hypothetical protein